MRLISDNPQIRNLTFQRPSQRVHILSLLNLQMI